MGWPVNLSVEVWALGAVGVLLLGVWLVRRWVRTPRRRFRVFASSREENFEVDLPKVVSNYRTRYPGFFRILVDFQRLHKLEELLADPDLKRAFARLAQDKPSPRPRSQQAYLSLQENGDREIRAAIITLVRGIYQRDEYRNGLSHQTHSEIDRLLESLT